MFKKYCKDCDLSSIRHIETWLNEITNIFIPRLKLPKKIEDFFDISFEKILSSIRLIKPKDNFLPSDIQMRSTCFINEAKKHGIKFTAIKGLLGYTNRFCADINNKKIRFESLPTACHINKYDTSFVDCKKRTKKHLLKGGFPIAHGKSFWFWQKRQALKFGQNIIGFPLVIKPRSGSVARHVTTNIKNKKELQKAINKTIVYSPAFVVERFIENSFVYRATVVDFDSVAVVKQVPSNIISDGVLTIEELIKKKNNDKKRGETHQKNFTLYKIVVDENTINLLAKKNYNLKTIPKKDETVFLQENPFLKLGGDLIEVTNMVHPDNIQLFKNIAKFFDIRLVGMDFLIPDISHSWKKQNCAVLELNSIPCIEMHHFPSSGTPQNIAGALVDLFFKYYL